MPTIYAVLGHIQYPFGGIGPHVQLRAFGSRSSMGGMEQTNQQDISDVKRIKRSIGLRLQSLWSEQGLTLGELGREAGLSSRTLDLMELGRGAMTWPVLVQVTSALNVRLRDVLDGLGYFFLDSRYS